MKIKVLGRQITIGNASYGLCGGMIFTAMDYFEAKMPIPSNLIAPSYGSLYEYIVKRQIESFHLPFGLLRYMVFMYPVVSDQETKLRMIKKEWPRIKNDLDNGKLSPLGLVRVKSLNPFEIRRNHQVLAYGYDINENEVSISIYDPNFPNDDQVTLSFNMGNPEATTNVFHSKSSEPIFSFFRTHYKFINPLAIN